MSQSSPRLSLPYLQPSQAQKHVTHNEALQSLDALVQLVLEEVAASTPPASPDPGAAYGLGPAPVGAWAGHSNALAIWQGEGWLFLMPQVGWRAWDRAGSSLRRWDGSAWVQLSQVPEWGIGTASDASNRLTVASDAALFTHRGAGHQLKINKAASTDTASLLFQSGFTGHAEMGLAGGNDFAVKVSGDGASWQEALVVKAATGRLGLGTATPAARLEIAASGEDYLVAGDGSALFRLSADGNGACAGAWSGGGADYAEYFEWQDGNPTAEDRRGISVVQEAGKIRAAQPGEIPIGIISAAPCLIGNDDGGTWAGRWQRDGFGACLRDRDGTRREVADFDPTRAYVPRAARREWALVGLLGRVALRVGQVVDPRWQKMREGGRSPEGSRLETWLVR